MQAAATEFQPIRDDDQTQPKSDEDWLQDTECDRRSDKSTSSIPWFVEEMVAWSFRCRWFVGF